jgi:hypothetical protein
MKNPILGTALAALFGVPAVASEGQGQGQYFCVAEHIAGVINTNKEGGLTMYSGNIKVPDEEMKFFIKVSSVTSDDFAFCEDGIDYWFNKIFKGIDIGPKKRVAERVHIPQCFASEKITWKSFDGKLTLKFWAYEGYGDYFGYEPQTWFKLYGDVVHTFQMGLGGLYQGPVVEDGHCTKIEPPN